ncbi:MAG TPA: type I polyketide synthase, partial [Pseudonocardia sp.]
MATSSDRVLDALRASLKESDRLRQHNQQLTEASWAPIAIVGMGCRFPGGVTNPDELWNLVATGGDAITEFPDDRGWGAVLSDNEGSYVQAGGFVEQTPWFDSGFFGISPREALAMDPQQRMLLEVTWETLEQAGIDPVGLRGSKTGVFAGGTHSGYAVAVAGTEGTGGYLLTGSLAAVISGRVAYALGLEGPAVTVDTACSSSLVAIHLACQSLRSGECSMALAGGVTVLATPDSFADFAQQGGLAPDGRCKAFASAANGIAWSEGAGMFLLECLTDARRNGHPVLAVIRGSAINQDGASNGLTAPNGPSQQRVIRAALSNARLSADEVDAVEAHGTGTTLGDPIEAQALLATYGRDRAPDRPLWLGSVKSNFAHTGAAAGAAGLMKMVQALRHQELPRTLHVDEPTARVDWSAGQIRLLTEPRPWHPEVGDPPGKARPRRAGVSSFGISGTNAHVIIEEAPAETPSAGDTPPDADAGSGRGDPTSEGPLPRVLTGPCVAWTVSARSAGALAGQARRLCARVGGDPNVDLADVGWSLVATRSVFERRAVVVGGDRAVLLSGLAAVTGSEPAAGVVSGVAAVRGPTVFVFPGQGSQWLGMGRELAGVSPVFSARLAECERALGPYVDWSLGAVLAGERDVPSWDRVDVVQPALWAVMVSLAAVWQAAGVRPDAVVGHSQGEIAAAVVAGILSVEDAAKVVALRSQALRTLSGRGGMASIGAPLEQVEAWLTERAGVAVAAVNGPDATVVSGELDELRRLLLVCEREGVRARILLVDYASHGPQVEGIREQVLGALSGIVPNPATVPMVSAMTGELLAGPEVDAGYWYASLRAPVQFDRAVRVLRERGHGVFVEVSAHPVLTAAIDATLDDMAGPGEAGGSGAGPLVVGTLRRDDGGAERMLASLAELWVHGVAVDWARVLVGGSRVELPTYAFEHQRFWPSSLSAGAGDLRSAGLDSIGHPLLGAAVELADGDARVVTGRLSVRTQPWLGEHVVGGFPFFPGTGYVELAVVAGHLVGCTRIEELSLAAPLVLPPETEIQVQITVSNPDQDGLRDLEIYARPQGAGADWVRYASGQIGPCGSPADQETTDFAAWPPRDATARDIGGLYESLAAAGQDYGPAFQGLSAVWERGEDIFVEVAQPEDVDMGAAAFGIHPTVLDATLHAVWMNMLDEGAQMPFVWADVSLFASGATGLRARLRRGPNGAVSLLAVDGAGSPVISVGRLALRPVPTAPSSASSDQPVEEAIFGVEWQALPDTDPATAPVAEAGRWVVVGADSLGVVEGLVAGGVEPEVHPDLAALADAAGPVPGVVLTAVGCGGLDRTDDGDQGRAARRLTNEVVALLQQWLSLDPLADTRLVVLTRGAVAVRAGEGVADLAAAAAWGLLRSAQTENPGRLLLVDLPAGAGADPSGDLVGVLTEAFASPEPELAIRDRQAHGRRLVRPAGLVTEPEASDDSSPAEESGAAEKPGVAGAVLITGGTGTLGGLTARHLADTGRAQHLLLVSRSGPGASSTGAGPAVVAAAVAEAGADVHIVAADTADRAVMTSLLAGLPAGCPLTGVVHTAGIVDDGVVGSLTADQVDAVMRSKTDTAWVLHELTRSHPVESFVMFSSTAAVFGGGGQGNYSAGNAFLDGLAAYRHAAGLPALSLAWGAWVAEIGIGRNLSASQLARVNSGGNFGAEEGLAVLDLALTRDEALLVPSRLDVNTLRIAASRGQALPQLLHALSGPIRPVISSAANAAPDTSTLHQQLARAPGSERDRILIQLVRTQAAAVLGHPSPEAIEPARAFTELGFDSLTAVDLRNRLNKATGLRLPATLVFDYPNPAALSQHITNQLTGVLDDVIPIPATTTATTDDPIAIVGMGCRFPGGV